MELTREIRNRRVALARDVIKRLDAKQIAAQSGNYFDNWHTLPGEGVERTACGVCAIGAAAVSALDPQNRLALLSPEEVDEEFGGRCRPDDITSQHGHPLAGIFSARELALIESAFESDSHPCMRGHAADAGDESDDEFEAASKFRESIGVEDWSYEDDEKALRAIYDSIIDNDGEVVFGRAD